MVYKVLQKEFLSEFLSWEKTGHTEMSMKKLGSGGNGRKKPDRT